MYDALSRSWFGIILLVRYLDILKNCMFEQYLEIIFMSLWK